ncbi:MAG: ABC transporter substrate-binding protein [Gammaproteobacteria bacterium]|nr:ABC transporter substrate-binding protein [Gammaproteobacteria bacterium]
MSVVFVMLNTLSCSDTRHAPLKLGTTVWVGYEPLYLGREKGFVDKKEIKLVELLSATQVMNAFRNKTIDIAALTMDEVLILAEEKFDLMVFLVLDASNGGDAVIANNKYSHFAQLKSKKIGYENTAVGAYMLSRALDKHNMKSGEVNLVSMNVNETERALLNEHVDAVVTFEPAKSRLIEKGFKEVFSSREIPNEILDVLIIRKELVDSEEDRLQRLVDGWFMTLNHFDRNKEASLAFMNQRLKLSDKGIATAFDGIVFPGKSENQNFFADDINESALSAIAVRISEEMRVNNLLKESIERFALYENKFVQN